MIGNTTFRKEKFEFEPIIQKYATVLKNLICDRPLFRCRLRKFIFYGEYYRIELHNVPAEKQPC